MNNRIPDISTAMTRLAADTVYPEGAEPERVTSDTRPRKMALVLSGGGASGAFEAGVIEEAAKAMATHNAEHPDNKLKFDVVIGTSTGALNSYGLLLHSLFKKGLLEEPVWLKDREGETVNYRLWRYLASFNKNTSKFVLDKTWMLKLIQGAGFWSRFFSIIMLAIITPLLLFGSFLLPDLLKIGKCISHLPCCAGWLSGAVAFGALLAFCLTLWKTLGLLQRSGRPVLLAYTFLLPSFFVLGCLQDILSVMIHSHPLNNFIGYGIALLFIPLLVVLILLSISGDALFGNSRLKQLVAAIADPTSKNGSLRRAVSRSSAEQYDYNTSTAVYNSWFRTAEKIPTFLFSATNISAEKQGLFLLGSEEDSSRLAAGHWLPIRIGENAAAGGSIDAAELLTGVIASTAIPATYPPEFVEYECGGPKRHIFVDGGVLDFAAYHAAIDLGCTHILSVETDCMDHDLMQKRATSDWLNILSNAAAVSYTGSDEEAREEAARIARTNRRVVYENLNKKNLILFYRIAPSANERMINAEEFNGRYKEGKQVNTLDEWILYGQKVNPEAGKLPGSIWYKDPNGKWRENISVRGPVIWDASFVPSPEYSK